jgi:hypothetical protein
MTEQQSKQATEVLAKFEDGLLDLAGALDALTKAGMDSSAAVDLLTVASGGGGDVVEA